MVHMDHIFFKGCGLTRWPASPRMSIPEDQDEAAWPFLTNSPESQGSISPELSWGKQS